MGVPVLTFDVGVNNVFTFNELANTTNSALFTQLTKHAALTDDNTNLNNPPFTAAATFTPNPPNFSGSIFTNISGTNFIGPNTFSGDANFSFKVIDKDIDFVRQGQTVTENVSVTITNSIGEQVTTGFVVNVIGANDRPTAHIDLLSISENFSSVKKNVLGNDTDPDLGDTKALTSAGFQVFSVTSAADPYLTKAMVAAARVNFSNNALPVKDSIQVTLNTAFQGLTTGENALIVIKYGMVDGFNATSASEFRLTIVGSADAQIVGTNANDPFIFGEKDADKIFGLAGNDTITPRGGNDTVTLGAGLDTIVFNTAPNAASNRDTITDFNPAQDTIRMENAIFTKLGAGVHALSAAFFWAGAAAHDANDYIVYNRASGALFYDVNGSAAGGAIQFATIANHAVLTFHDFFVI